MPGRPTERLTGIRVARLAVNTAGADGSFGIRARVVISEPSRRGPPEKLDIFGFAVGRDEIIFYAGQVAGSFPRQIEQRLSSLLVDRALLNPH